jgi:hypothetical protein
MRLYLHSTVRSLSAQVFSAERNANTSRSYASGRDVKEEGNGGVHTMMFTAAVVEVLASTGIPVAGLNATLLNLNPSAGDLFQDPWKGT